MKNIIKLLVSLITIVGMFSVCSADSKSNYSLASGTAYEMPQSYSMSSGDHYYSMDISYAKFVGLGTNVFPSDGGIRMIFYSTTGTRYVIRNFSSTGTRTGSYGLNNPKTIKVGVDNTSNRNCVASFSWDVG